jgi:hypothetical protein
VDAACFAAAARNRSFSSLSEYISRGYEMGRGRGGTVFEFCGFMFCATGGELGSDVGGDGRGGGGLGCGYGEIDGVSR